MRQKLMTDENVWGKKSVHLYCPSRFPSLLYPLQVY